MGRRLSMLGEWVRYSANAHASGDYPWRDEWRRSVALSIMIPIAIICFGGFVWALFVLPLWIALLTGIPLVALGFFLAFWAVSKSMPDKLRNDE
jgi:hypothetical protein